MRLASSPGHSRVFNVARTWEWPGDEANRLGLRPQACEYHYKGHDPRKVLYRPIVK